MNTTLQFRGPAEGSNIANDALAVATLMGRPADPMELAANLAKGQLDGKLIPVNWMAATTKVMPGGGLAPTGDETAKYVYRGADMFGIDPNAPKAGA